MEVVLSEVVEKWGSLGGGSGPGDVGTSLGN